MIKKQKSLFQKEFAAAIKLIAREQGATTEELQAVMHRASFDCPTILRNHIARYMPDWAFISERTKRGRHGNCRVYKLR
jgi:hypothetical protein